MCIPARKAERHIVRDFLRVFVTLNFGVMFGHNGAVNVCIAGRAELDGALEGCDVFRLLVDRLVVAIRVRRADFNRVVDSTTVTRLS